MDELEKEIISIFLNSQKESNELFVKNNLIEDEIKNFNIHQHHNFVMFKSKLLEYKNKLISQNDKPIKKVVNESYCWEKNIEK
jgi:hypothetical protein